LRDGLEGDSEAISGPERSRSPAAEILSELPSDRSEPKDPEGAGCNHAASGSSTEKSRGERLDAAWQRMPHRGPSTLPRSACREVPLRMTEVRSPHPHDMLSRTRSVRGPAPLPHCGSPEDQWGRFLACGSEQHVVWFCSANHIAKIVPFNPVILARSPSGVEGSRRLTLIFLTVTNGANSCNFYASHNVIAIKANT
jgi:hypothetical protein